ncbi:MAG TPA: DUF2382 domain-containing protein [Rubrobacter sp.]|nr:DUF2382 domain-containing protein [Rubrobacter sp.]
MLGDSRRDQTPVHVLPRDDGWAVVREGREQASSVHPTQAEAAKVGREIARKDGVEFLLHAKDGRVRDRSDYGEEPTPPSAPREDASNHTAAGVAGAATRAASGVVGLATGAVGGAIEGLGPAPPDVSQESKTPYGDRRTDDTDEEAGGLVYEERYADYEVHDRDGDRLGHVDSLFIDEDDRPEYIGVKMGLLGTRSTLIPWAAVTRADEERGRLEVNVDKEAAASGPAFEDGQEITPEMERRVRGHYGLEQAPEDRGAFGDYHAGVGQTGATAGPGNLGAATVDTATGGLRERRDAGEASSPAESDPAVEGEIRVQRSEEELVAGTREREAGAMRIRKRVRTNRERVEVPVRREEVRVERVPVSEETPGAEIGEEEVVVPVTETEISVSKRAGVKEEIRIRKDVVEETEVVEEDVRREEIEIEDDTDRRREG